MTNFKKPITISDSAHKQTFRLPSESLVDKAKVRLGGQGPAFRKASIEDKGKVRLGGQGPIFRV